VQGGRVCVKKDKIQVGCAHTDKYGSLVASLLPLTNPTLSVAERAVTAKPLSNKLLLNSNHMSDICQLSATITTIMPSIVHASGKTGLSTYQYVVVCSSVAAVG
jgi:hypothetical protein